MQPVPYASLAAPRPPVMTWYAVYCAAMALLYVAVAVGIGLLTANVDLDATKDPEGARIQLGVMLVLCIPLAVMYLAGLVLPRRKWVWIYGIVLIGIGLTGCTAVAAIPLLIFWLKPETKAWFGYPPPPQPTPYYGYPYGNGGRGFN